MPVSASLLDVLHAYGHEGIHAHDRDLHRAADPELLAVARRVSSYASNGISTEEVYV
jgi:hypothetical protein